MGIDYLDIMFRLEKEFHIEIDRVKFYEYLVDRYTDESLHQAIEKYPVRDFRVQDLVDFVTRIVLERNPTENERVFSRVTRCIADALFCDEREIGWESWFAKDLGME